MIDMKPVVMDGRVLMTFPHRGDPRSPLTAADTQRRAIHGASRGSLLKNWPSPPPAVRRDDGCCGLMDHYRPTTEEEYAIKQRIAKEITRQSLFDSHGSGAA